MPSSILVLYAINSFSLHSNIIALLLLLFPFLKMILSNREVKQVAPGHMSSRSQNSNPGSLSPEFLPLTSHVIFSKFLSEFVSLSIKMEMGMIMAAIHCCKLEMR